MQVDRLERGKSQIAYAYAVQRTEQFIATARTYFERARTILQGVTNLATKREGIVAPVVPSQ